MFDNEFYRKQGEEGQKALRLKIGEAAYRKMKHEASMKAAEARKEKVKERRELYLKGKEIFGVDFT